VSACRRLAWSVLPALLLAGAPAATAASSPLQAAAGRAQTAGQTASYVDTCRDAAGSSLDLRGISFSDDGDGTFTLTVTSCTAWTPDDLGRGSIDIPLFVPGAGDDGYDYAIIVEQESNGSLSLTTYRAPSGGGGAGTATYGPVAVADPSDGTMSASFPVAALDGATEFDFLASSLDSDRRDPDLLPESYADRLGYPFACTVDAGSAATVVVDADQAERLSLQAVSSGVAVRSAHPQVLSLAGVSDAGLAQLRRTPGVRSADRPVVYERLVTPDDTKYPRQWSLDDEVGGIGAPAGWAVRTGSGGAVLAVIDDGVDGVRIELAGRVLEGKDTVYGVRLPPDSDLGGHGTAVAGLAAANTDNGTGVAGVDWDASVLPYRVFDAAGCATDAAVVAALYDAADRGASVANLSLGGPADSAALRQAVADVTARGVLVVAASGNSRETAPDEVSYPAAYDEVLAVGASTRDRSVARYSSDGPHVDVAAPGGTATGSPDDDLLALGERESIEAVAGTSFAAPLVAASVTLFRAEHPEQTPAQAVAAVRRSASDAGDPGVDPDFGAGILDLDALLHLSVAKPRSTEQACPPDQVPPSGFDDVPAGSAHAGNIDCIAWWQVSTGANGGYQPAAEVTRAQMAAFLARVIARTGGALDPEPPDAFTDDEDSVHELRINQLAALGVVGGLGDGRYGPQDRVTRGQMATFLTRAYEKRTGARLPSDGDYFGDDTDTTHETRINAAAAAGFTGGVPDGGYGPALFVRRDAMATFLARVLDRLVAEGEATPPGA
jgi:hypothetical protein